MDISNLPPELQEIRSVLPEIIARLEERIPYVSALVTQESGTYLGIDSRQENMSEKPPRRGIVFTLFNGRYFQEWATDNLDIHFLKSKVDHMYGMFEGVETGPALLTIDPGELVDQHFDSKYEISPDSIELTDMVDGCRNLIDRVQSMEPKIVNTSVHYSDGKEFKVFANRNKLLSSALTTCAIQLVVVGNHNKKTVMNFTGAGGVTGFEAIKFKRETLQEVIDDLNLLFASKPLDPGNYDVIASPEVSGIVAHEAFGHGVETDMFVKDRAKAVHYMDKPVASPLVNMVDDPALPGLNGSYFFDDEGQLAAPTHIIESGILRRGLTDLRSAAVLGIQRSANGRRESFERKVYARMSNTYFAPGEHRFEDMIQEMDQGLYLKKSSSGMEDPKGWGIQVGVNLAQEIRKGKLTSNVYAPLTMTGYMVDLLMSISRVGDTLDFMGVGGMCGKGHKEMVRVSSGGPHLRFKVRLG